MLGISLVFTGFLIAGIFGAQFFKYAVQADEFDSCFDYTNDGRAIPVNCNVIMQYKAIFFGIVLALIGGGIFALIKGVRGKWDQDVKSNEMVGPKRD